MNARTKALLGSAATVVVIAAVILGLWAFGSARRPVAPTITVSPQQRSQQALRDGLAALSKEETGTAEELFQSAVRIDPENTAAQDALTKLRSGTSAAATNRPPAASNAATNPAPAASSDTWEKQLDVATLLPRSYPAFALGSVSKVGADAVITGSPTNSSTGITRIAWAVHDRESDVAAADFIAKTSKSVYTHDPMTIVVNGTPAYFATDGKQFATVVYTRGRYVFELVITTSEAPATERKAAEAAAAAFKSKP
jgi:hypothetical protein